MQTVTRQSQIDAAIARLCDDAAAIVVNDGAAKRFASAASLERLRSWALLDDVAQIDVESVVDDYAAVALRMHVVRRATAVGLRLNLAACVATHDGELFPESVDAYVDVLRAFAALAAEVEALPSIDVKL